MRISDGIGEDGVAHPNPPDAGRSIPKSFLLGLVISAMIWALLAIATVISASSPVVPELPGVLLAR